MKSPARCAAPSASTTSSAPAVNGAARIAATRSASHQASVAFFVMRQKVEAGNDLIEGANKTLTFIIKSENQADVSKQAMSSTSPRCSSRRSVPVRVR